MKVNKIEVSGYNKVKKTYKLNLDITQQVIGQDDVDSQKMLSLTWKDIKKGLEKINLNLCKRFEVFCRNFQRLFFVL